MPAVATTDEASPARGIALAVLLNLANKKVLSLELASSVQVAIDLSQQRIRDGNAIEAERVAVGKIAAADDRPVAALNGAALPVPDRSASVAQRSQVSVPRVYVQIFDEAGRDQARALPEWCTKPQRWLVPGIENVSAGSARESDATTGSGTGEVRFFHE